MENKYIEELKRREIKPTAMRLLILKAMMEFEEAFCLLDLENYLVTVDKSTIFRTISIFLEKHLIHKIDDGSGSLKYAICKNTANGMQDDSHVHFYCLKCRKTFCLRHVEIPSIALPPHFTLESINFVMKGICANCAQIEDKYSPQETMNKNIFYTIQQKNE